MKFFNDYSSLPCSENTSTLSLLSDVFYCQLTSFFSFLLGFFYFIPSSFHFSVVYRYLICSLSNKLCACAIFCILSFSCIVFIFFSSYSIMIWFEFFLKFSVLLPFFYYFTALVKEFLSSFDFGFSF